MAAGVFALGYSTAAIVYQRTLIDSQLQHVADMERLDHAYSIAISALSQQITTATKTADAAANTAQQAARTAANAADKLDKDKP